MQVPFCSLLDHLSSYTHTKQPQNLLEIVRRKEKESQELCLCWSFCAWPGGKLPPTKTQPCFTHHRLGMLRLSKEDRDWGSKVQRGAGTHGVGWGRCWWSALPRSPSGWGSWHTWEWSGKHCRPREPSTLCLQCSWSPWPWSAWRWWGWCWAQGLHSGRWPGCSGSWRWAAREDGPQALAGKGEEKGGYGIAGRGCNALSAWPLCSSESKTLTWSPTCARRW